MRATNDMYQTYRTDEVATGKYPVFKASGVAYIRFAKEEKELFKLLFMRDRTEGDLSTSEEWTSLSAVIKENLKIQDSEVHMIQLEMWIFVHGIASALATSYLTLDEKLIDQMLTDAYLGISERYQNKQK